MGTTALTPALQTQINSLNTAVNRLLTDRDRIVNIFEDGLGATTWSLLTPANQLLVKNAIIADMQVAATEIDAIIAALQAL